jgi:ATP-binding cassette subfamily F protein uup
VATVDDGTFVVEQRGARSSDWVIEGLSASASTREVETEDVMASKNEECSPLLRKQAYNAPKRIANLEILIEDADGKIALLDEEMLANGSDLGKLVDLTKEKEALEIKVMEYMEGWEQLEVLFAQ